MPVCPRCQNPYGSGARFCQQCGHPLAEPEPPAEETPASTAEVSRPAASRRLPPWLWAVIGAGVFLLILAAVFLVQKRPPAPPAEAPVPEAGLQEQLATLLNNLRQAQVDKDINRLMSCYAMAFPGRDRKAEDTQKAWQDFDFTAMFFSIEDLQADGPEHARARVVWDLQLRDRRTDEFLTATQIFRVEFVKEQGAWRIRSLEEVGAP